jgi:hypothetical protein
MQDVGVFAGLWPISPYPANPETSGKRWSWSRRRWGSWACRQRVWIGVPLLPGSRLGLKVAAQNTDARARESLPP